MKKNTIIAIFLLVFSTWNIYAEDFGQVAYKVIVTGANIPEQAEMLLTSRLEQAVAHNGYGTMSRTDRFVMLAKCNILQRDVAPTTPVRISQIIGIDIIIGDAVENKIYSSCSIEVKGIGINEVKAWQSAIQTVTPRLDVISSTLKEAGEKIEEYYNGQCQSLISKARSLSARGKSDEAIAILSSIPNICTACFDKANNVMVDIYLTQLNRDAMEMLQQAKNAWALDNSEHGAEKAMALLEKVSPDSNSYGECLEFGKEIAAKLSVERERQWQIKVQMYKDKLAMDQQRYSDEKEMQQLREQHEHKERMATIVAAREVGKQWAESRPQTNVYLKW